ncbi:MAG TPA: flagellar basal body rod protein FlgB [Nitrospira sp.]|nr:flagellar basal body rod protein FlgB [Nitrospira sp. WS110]HMS84296.1 flagellar basal body rod protein FlgB [Nitrospira sp.]
MKIFDESFELARVLDLRSVQHRVSIANIANEETPGYRAKELHFKDALAAARQDAMGVIMHTTNARHLMLPIVTTEERIAEVPAADLPLDANSVNLELEMAKLSENAMQYKAIAEILRKEFGHILSAIREGR